MRSRNTPSKCAQNQDRHARTNWGYSASRTKAAQSLFASRLALVALLVVCATPARGQENPAAGASPAAGQSGTAKKAPAGENHLASAKRSSTSAEGKSSAPAKGKDLKDEKNNPFGAFNFSADNGPIQIRADSLNLDYKKNSVEFQGRVHAAQSGTTLTSNRLTVIYGEKFGDVKEVIALGNVKLAQGGRWATGQRAVLDEVKHTVEMTGEPVIHDGQDQVAGRRIIIYLDNQKSFVEGASAVIFPRTSGKTDNEFSEQ